MIEVHNQLAGSCAAIGVNGLRGYEGPKEAMTDLLKSILLISPTWGKKVGDEPPRFTKLTSHIVFTSGPDVPGHYWSATKGWYKYGVEFAAYIEKHKLGNVVTLPAVKNVKHHPDSTCQVWIWQPDQKALEAWWNENYPYVEKPKPEVKKVEPEPIKFEPFKIEPPKIDVPPTYEKINLDIFDPPTKERPRRVSKRVPKVPPYDVWTFNDKKEENSL